MSAESKEPSITDNPLVAAYLRSLDRALIGTENQQEVIESVREHIAEALAADGADSANSALVHEVLNDLGPVERIASTQGAAGPIPPPMEPAWPVVIAVIIAGASLPLAFAAPLIAAGIAIVALVWSIVRLRGAGSRSHPALLLTVIILSSLTLVVTLIGAIFLLRGSNTVTIHSPVPVGSSVIQSNN